MKLFCGKVLFFIVILSSILFSVTYLLNNKAQNNQYYRLSPDTKYLFVGSSFVSCGIRDSEIDGAVNLSLAGESFFYSYPKIRKIIDANPQLKYIFLDYSNFKLTKIIDKYMWTDMYLSTQYLRYAPLFENSDKLAILTDNPIGFLSIQPMIARETIGFLEWEGTFYPSYKYWGGYDEFRFSKTDSLIRVNHQSKATHQDIFEVGPVNLKYLEKIKKLCIEKGVNLILFRTPTHRLDPYRANEEFFQNYRKENLAGITFLDFHNFPLENKEFLDLDHLNYFGATKLSSFLNSLIKDSLWVVDDKQEYIERNIRLQEIKSDC